MDKWSKNTLSHDSIINKFKELRLEHPNDLIQIDFFGGEPLLQMKMVKSVISTMKKVDDNYALAMPTNGISLTPGILDYLLKENVKISISFDGLWQNDRRPIRDSNLSSLDVLYAKRELFSGLKCHSMISGSDYNLLENHLYITRNFGMNPGLTLVRDRGTWTPESVKLLQIGIDEMYEWYKNNITEDMPNFILSWLRDILRYHYKGFTAEGCGVGRNLYALTETGESVTCDRFTGDKEAAEKIDQFYSMPECSTCRVKDYCHKGCMYEQIKSNGPIPELCDIYKYCYDKTKEILPLIPRDIIRREFHDS